MPAERTALFPYAVDVEAFRDRSVLSPAERAAVRERLGVPADAPLVLSLAKLNDREAPWDLLRAFDRLRDREIWLVLAGDGPERADLEGTVEASGLARVRFPGYVPYPELPALYAVSDLFVHPAREERWGVSVQEALACGLPVIASSRVGAGRDLIEPGRQRLPLRGGMGRRAGPAHRGRPGPAAGGGRRAQPGDPGPVGLRGHLAEPPGGGWRGPSG